MLQEYMLHPILLPLQLFYLQLYQQFFSTISLSQFLITLPEISTTSHAAVPRIEDVFINFLALNTTTSSAVLDKILGNT